MVFAKCAPNFRAKAAAKRQALKQKLAGVGAYHGVSLRLLLVDRQVDAQGVLPNAALDCVHVVKYDAKETTLAELVGLVREAHRQNGAPFLSMAIAQHGADAEGQWEWTTDLTVNLKSMHGAIDQLAPVIEVLAAALSKTKAGKAHIDLLACNLATTCKGLIPALEKMYGIDFRASTDETGNDLSGGDWKMETDNDYDVSKDYLDAVKIKEYTETMAITAFDATDYNTPFVRDPVAFLNHHRRGVMGADDWKHAAMGNRWSRQEYNDKLPQATQAACEGVADMLDGEKEGRFYLTPVQSKHAADRTGFVLRPMPHITVYHDHAPILSAPPFAPYIMPLNPIGAYYFPYTTNPNAHKRFLAPAGLTPADQEAHREAQFGWVDFPKVPDAAAGDFDFVFTGAMNGCHLAVTQSPRHATHYRVYHINSPGGLIGAETNLIYQHWPAAAGPLLAYLDDIMYKGGDDDESVEGFNFLWYNRAVGAVGWQIVSQRLQSLPQSPRISDEKKFSRHLDAVVQLGAAVNARGTISDVAITVAVLTQRWYVYRARILKAEIDNVTIKIDIRSRAPFIKDFEIDRFDVKIVCPDCHSAADVACDCVPKKLFSNFVAEREGAMTKLEALRIEAGDQTLGR